MLLLESRVEAIRQEMERIVASPGFARNERLSRFLRFVVEGHLEGKDRDLKESVIAVEVFGRPPNFDFAQVFGSSSCGLEERHSCI